MKVNIVFKHSRKSKQYAFSPATFFFDRDCSTGPVILKGSKHGYELDVRAGDTLEFSTTKFDHEVDFRHWRGDKLLNAPEHKFSAKSARRLAALAKDPVFAKARKFVGRASAPTRNLAWVRA